MERFDNFIFVIAGGEKYSLWTYNFELEICPEGSKPRAGLVRLLIFWNTADFPQFSMLMLRQYAKVAYICCYFQEISKFQRNL